MILWLIGYNKCRSQTCAIQCIDQNQSCMFTAQSTKEKDIPTHAVVIYSWENQHGHLLFKSRCAILSHQMPIMSKQKIIIVHMNYKNKSENLISFNQTKVFH